MVPAIHGDFNAIEATPDVSRAAPECFFESG